jgi:teichuronic acid exporter
VDIGQKVNRGLAWVGAAQTLVALLDVAAFFIILGFWVSNEEYGITMLAYSLFPVLDIIGDLGCAAAVVGGKEHTHEQLSTLFWLNLVLVLGVFLCIAVFAPVLAWIHGFAVIGWMLTAWGGKLVFQTVYLVPWALMRRDLRFGELSTIRIIANLVEAILKVGSAALGAHLWCWIIGGFGRQIVTAIGVRYCNPWRPSFRWAPREAWEAMKFGLRTSASQLLYYLYASLDVQVVGYAFGPSGSGLYVAATYLVLEPVKILSSVVSDVAFPAFARLRHNSHELAEQLVRFVRLNLALILPYVALIGLVSADFVTVFKPAWEPAVTSMRVLCGVGVLRSLSAIGPPLFYGIGRPQIVLRYMVAATLTLPTLYVVFASWLHPLGILSVALAWACGYPIAFAVLAALAAREIRISFRDFFRRIGGVAACTPLAAIPAGAVMWLLADAAPLTRLAVTTATFVALFALLLVRWQKMAIRLG